MYKGCGLSWRCICAWGAKHLSLADWPASLSHTSVQYSIADIDTTFERSENTTIALVRWATQASLEGRGKVTVLYRICLRVTYYSIDIWAEWEHCHCTRKLDFPSLSWRRDNCSLSYLLRESRTIVSTFKWTENVARSSITQKSAVRGVAYKSVLSVHAPTFQQRQQC